MNTELYEKGLKIRREVVGDAYASSFKIARQVFKEMGIRAA